MKSSWHRADLGRILFLVVVLSFLVSGCPKGAGDGSAAAEGKKGEPLREWTWKPQQMPIEATGQANHEAVRLSNGKVLVIGGQSRLGRWSASSSLYNPETGQWQKLPDLNSARSDFEAVALEDGRALVVGGMGTRHKRLKSAEVFDPETNEWSKTKPAPGPLHRHGAALLPDGDVLVVGPTPTKLDKTADGKALHGSGAFRFDVEQETWSKASPIAEVIFRPAVIGTSNGAIVIGGKSTDPQPKGMRISDLKASRKTYRYNAKKDKWREGPSLTVARPYPIARRLSSREILVTGSRSLGEPAEVLDEKSGSTQKVDAPFDAPVWSPAINGIPTGPIVQLDTRSVAVYRKQKGWRELPKLPDYRRSTSVTRLADDSVLVAAGIGDRRKAQTTSLRLISKEITDGGASIGASSLATAAYEARATAKRVADQLLLGREEINTLGEKSHKALGGSKLLAEWKASSQKGDGNQPTVATWPMRNQTGFPVGGSLDALLSKIETRMVNDYPVAVIDLSSLPELKRELERQEQSDEYAPKLESTSASPVPVDYLVTGKAKRTDQSGEGDLAIDYRVVLKVVELKTGEIVFQSPVDLRTSATVR